MARRLLILMALVAISLVPAVLLYMLFGDLNSAAIDNTGLKLGGPVAAFFVVLSFLWRMYKFMLTRENPLESRMEALTGSWQLESTSGHSQRKARSETTIKIDDGELRIDGGTFFAVNNDGSKGNPIGNWSVEMAVCDGRRLKYFYHLTDNLVQQSSWKGLVEASLQEDAGQPEFVGTWQVLGKEAHAGTIILKKQATQKQAGG